MLIIVGTVSSMPKPIKEIKGIHNFIIHVENDGLDDNSQGMYTLDRQYLVG